jgi:succinyl-CoA synthetase beta subunit
MPERCQPASDFFAGVLLIGCSEGGTSIEDLAEKYPEKIVRIPVDIREGITDEQARPSHTAAATVDMHFHLS